MLVDVIIVLAFIVYAFLGFRNGFMRSVVGLVKTSVAIVVAALLAKPVSSFAGSIIDFGVGDLELWIGTAVAIFLLIQIALFLCRRVIDRLTENQVVNAADSWLGLAFGVLKLCVILFICFSAIYVISKIPLLTDTKNQLLGDSDIGSWLYDRTVEILKSLF